MQSDTDIGGRHHRFPATRGSVLLAMADADPQKRLRAFDTLVSAYWKPVYKYLRIRWSATNEEAKDLTQEFFSRMLTRGDLERYEPGKALFRTYLRVCLDGFVANERRSERRLKRGGGRAILSLDFGEAEGELGRIDVPRAEDPDALFHQEWVRSVFAMAVEALRVRCESEEKRAHFALFARHELDGDESVRAPSHAELAREFGLTPAQVNNSLALGRRWFRQAVLEAIQSLCGSDAEFRAEARDLLGVNLE